jgi:hypothetical protein
LDQYLDLKRSKQILLGAAARLSKPKLASAFGQWRQESMYERMAASKMSHKQRLEAEESKRNALQTEVDKLRAELKAARGSMLEGTGREAELTRQARAELEAQREKRVEHTQRMAMFRLGKRELTLGWTTWLDGYLGRKHQLALLRTAVVRITKLQVARAYTAWRRMAMKQAAEVAQKALVAAEAELIGSRGASAQQMAMLEVALEESRTALETAREKAATEHAQCVSMRKAAEEAKAEARLAAEQRSVMEVQLKESAEVAKGTLTKLLNEQRTVSRLAIEPGS